MVYVDKKDEVRFHCFGACRGDWNIYDLIMLRMKQGFATAQQMWAMTDSLLPRFENDFETFNAFLDSGLIRFLNDNTAKGYRYYCRQIDFSRKALFSRNYGDAFAGRIVFPIYDADANPAGLVGRLPDDRGVR